MSEQQTFGEWWENTGSGTKLLILGFFLIILFTIANQGGPSQPPSTTEATASREGAWSVCTQFVEDRLKAPATAEFPIGEFDESVRQTGGSTFEVASYVDAENSFGANIRTDFVCRVRYTGGDRYELTSLTLDE